VKKLLKVLIFIDWYSPGYKAGGPIRSCVNMVNHLKQYFDFYIVTRDTDYTESFTYDSITSNSWNEIDGAQVYYLSNQEITNSNIRKFLKDIEPDVVYINGIYSLYFSILPLIISRQLGYQKIIVAGRGMFARSAIQVKGLKKMLFFRFAKFLKFYRYVTFHATNQQEVENIRAVLGMGVKIKIAPNLPEVSITSIKNSIQLLKKEDELNLVSVARIAPEKNTLFALELLRAFKGEGLIRFDLYGPVYNDAYWRDCEAVIAQMPSKVFVQYKGSLEKDKVHDTLQQYHALFMPTQGENFGHIILESLLAGCPVLISDQTPWRDLVVEGAGYDIPLNATAAYLKALQELLQLNQDEFDLLSGKAIKLGLSYCQNDEHLKANRALFESE
jgi:glycosyltransferase involved in cell wall biosynthesis